MKKPAPIKVAYIIDTIATPSAGTEKQLLFLLRGLNRELVQPYLMCLYESDWMRTQNFAFPVYCLGWSGFFAPSQVTAYRRFKSIHRIEKFDIAQTFFKDGNIFGTVAAHLAGCRTIISSRRNVGYWHNRLHIALLCWLRRYTDYYLANSQAAVEKTVEIEGASPDKFHIIYNGLELEEFRKLDSGARQRQRMSWNVSPDEILVGTVANLRPVKNIDFLLSVASGLCKKYPELRFVVVGEGDDRPRLENMVQELSLTDRFALPGRMENVLPALAAFDVALLPSSNESFSNALIEYMAAGKPIVASDVGGNKEAVAHGVTGWLYSPNDRQALADSLSYLLDHSEVAAEAGRNAAEQAFRLYSVEQMLRQHEEFYLRVVEEAYEKTH